MKNNRIYNILKKMNSNFEIYFDYMPNYVALLTFSHLLYLSRKFRASSLLYPMLTSHVLYYLQNRRLRTAYFQFLFEENFRDLLVLLGDNFPEFDEQIRQFFREDNHCLPDKIHLQSFYFQKHLEELSRPGEYMLPNDISVKLIDTKSSLQEFSATIDELMCSESKVCAGFDTEFTTSIKGKLTLSIIQIAINDCVYIFDAYVLEYLSLQPQIKDLLIKLLDPKHFICLFFDATSDLQLINDKINYHNSSTSESDDAAHEPHIIDPDAVFDLKKIVHRAMKTKANALDNELKSFINNSTLTSNPSLQKLCQAILGFSLNKTETLSSWLSRPLLDSQIQYAATDAYILVLLYKKLERLSPSLSCTYNFK
ncbi:MAG: Exonuclease mut-7 [Marteilia pararefringens]